MRAKGTPQDPTKPLPGAAYAALTPHNAYWSYWPYSPYKRDNPTAQRSARPSADGGYDDKSATQRYLRRGGDDDRRRTFPPPRRWWQAVCYRLLSYKR